jgi:hypothetical protein
MERYTAARLPQYRQGPEFLNEEDNMGKYGRHWRVDGVEAAFITRGQERGEYKVVFERDAAELSQLEAIHWEKPTIEHLVDREETALPENYGFTPERITYDSGSGCYTVTVTTATQYLGDVTAYQAELDALTEQSRKQQTTIADQEQALTELDQQVADLTGELAEADELAISLYEAQSSGEEATV